ncbi:MAG: addiction module protein [Melioribacteraceae bacterium]|jgi:putative addiction module component (TIGR02574 family)|nr:addiction module protein [Melioribacteraceae bacterium]
MDSKTIIESALNLSPAEKLILIDAISESLNEPNKEIEKYWKEEVENRYKAYLDGKIKTISIEDVFKK